MRTENQLKKTTTTSKALELLYEVVSSTNHANEIEDILIHFMHRLGRNYRADAGVVRILKNSQFKLIDNYGFGDKSDAILQNLPLRGLINNESPGTSVFDVHLGNMRQSSATGMDIFRMGLQKILYIPLQYRFSILGCYQLIVSSELNINKEERELLLNIGYHLGVAIEQSHLDQDARKLPMVEERARLANELHDSLAQTLASLRIQVRIVDETLHQGDEQVTWEEMEKLESTVEEANKELRGLIGQFRVPLQTQEVIISVDKLIRRFKRDSGISVFFQNEWEEDDLPQELRTDVIHIVQESLSNIKRHADAKTVRVLLRHQGGRYRLIVEDDGVGFDDYLSSNERANEHIGLKIMNERANNLGTTLRVESESGDGCRIGLDFDYEYKTEIQVSG